MVARKASHAGSWYSSSASELGRQLEGWLAAADPTHSPARAIIAPHAGYSFCGSCAGHAYKQINPHTVRRIFILGPSHHVHLPGCALSEMSKYETPFYDLNIDTAIYEELMATGEFDKMTRKVDEDEHSIEMHLPYIAKVMQESKDPFTIIPVLVGALNSHNEQKYGQIFSRYLSDPNNLFIISSDFCHWGRRFHYVHYDEQCGDIHQSIEALDRQGMAVIEKLDSKGFTQYLKKFGNTICGRHPIGVFLNAVSCLENGHKPSLRFLNYDQSSHCKTFNDSSVSYAAASLVVPG